MLRFCVMPQRMLPPSSGLTSPYRYVEVPLVPSTREVNSGLKSITRPRRIPVSPFSVPD